MLLKTINRIKKAVKSAKISIKLTVLYAVMFSLVLLILNASILYGVRYYLYTQAQKQVDDIENMISNKFIEENRVYDLSDKEIFDDIPENQNIYVKLTDENGNLINSTYNFKLNIKDSHIKKDPQDKYKKIEVKDKELFYKNVKLETKYYGVLNVEIIKDMDNEYDFLKILFVFMAVADLIGMVASLILGYIVSKKMLKPINHITETAENISINNLKERIEGNNSDDELNRLIKTFNNMIDRLQESFDRQVQFVSDASHELRTPITVIQGYANLLDRWGKDDREALEKSIYAIKLEASNMADLVEKLLFLAKGDSGTQLIEKKEFKLNELIDEVVTESLIIAPNHIITCNKNDAESIIADYKMIKQMLRIFIDNSIKFTLEQNKIDISSEVKDKTVFITVSDSGIGIPKDEIESVFHRFYIVDKSRSKEKGGTGLGLSIAEWIVNMHQGEIYIESEEGVGTKIIVKLNL